MGGHFGCLVSILIVPRSMVTGHIDPTDWVIGWWNRPTAVGCASVDE